MKSKGNDRVMTPDWCAADMIHHFHPTGLVLEPFRGDGAFTRLLPDAEWCEKDAGKDFAQWSTPVDWIISNPPYSITRAVFRHAFRVAHDVVFLVPLRNVFSGFGFVREIYTFGGIVEIRVYGTGGSLGFPMGNCIGALYMRRGYTGDTRFSFYELESPRLLSEEEK